MTIREHLSRLCHLLGTLLAPPKKELAFDDIVELLATRAQLTAIEINKVVLTAEHKIDIWKILNQDELPRAHEVLDEYTFGVAKDLCEELVMDFLREVHKIHLQSSHLDFDDWMRLQGGGQSAFEALRDFAEMRAIYIVSEIIKDHKELTESNQEMLTQYGTNSITIEE